MHGHIRQLEGKIYTALYRKWRPQNFEEVKGQQHITKTLANAVKTGKIAHAYLFVGPRGVGKTSVARIFAKALNCEKGPTPYPCNTCNSCVKITKGISLDVLEIDGASNRGIDQIRELKERIKFSPVEGRYKIYIIDEVHMLTNEAFNALLKTLEEPPPHVIFIFATTDPQKLPATILSRCQRFDFKRLTPEIIRGEVKRILEVEGVTFEEDAVSLISQMSDGSMRDALSILEQVIAYTEGSITYDATLEVLGIAGEDVIYEILKGIKSREKESVLKIVGEALERGVEPRTLYLDIIKMLRNLMLFMIGGKKALKEETEDYIKKLEYLSKYYTHKDVEVLLDRFISFEIQMKTTTVPRIVLEFLLLFSLNEKELPENKESKQEDVEKQKHFALKEEVVESKEEIEKKDPWETLLSSLDNKVLENSLKNNVKSYRFEDNKLILLVPREMKFYLEEKKGTLKCILQKILNKQIDIIFNEEEQKKEDNHVLLKEALRIFGGRIITTKDNQEEV